MKDAGSVMSGISDGSASNNTAIYVESDEEEVPKLKKKAVPKRETGLDKSGLGESFVAVWIKPSEEVTPTENLFQAMVKIIRILVGVDNKASFQCVYDESSAFTIDPTTNKVTPLKPLTCADDVPLEISALQKYFEVAWDKMMVDQRARIDKNGKPWKQWSISGTFLLKSAVCDHYLCSKVNSGLGTEGIRLNVKEIQVLKTMVVSCLTCVSNLADLTAIKAIILKLINDTEALMIKNGRHKQYDGTDLQDFTLTRRPAKEPIVPEKYKLKGLGEEYRSLKTVIMIETEADAGSRLHSILYMIQKGGSLKKYLGQNATILGMGPYGPKAEDMDGQCDRAQYLKVNVMYHCCTDGATLNGMASPNKNSPLK